MICHVEPSRRSAITFVCDNSCYCDAPSNVTLYLLEVNVKERLAAYIPKDANDDTFSFLKNTFQYLPTDGKANLADDIESCCSDEELQQLAKHTDTALIRPFLAVGGRSKPVTPSPRFGTEDSIENLLSEIDDPVVREQERLRTQCLSRDGYRCVITKAYEETANPPPQILFVGNLIAAHIIPFCLGSFSTNDELRGLGEIWQCFYRYFPGVRSRLNFTQASINNMQNVMMLETAVHTHFGRFKLALEPTSVENQYRIWHSFTTGLPLYAHSFPQDRIITLKAQDGRYPLPSPILIETHYLIARIINATGRGEVVNDILRDYNGTPTLARDGTTDISRLLSVTTLGPSLHSGRPRNIPITDSNSVMDRSSKSGGKSSSKAVELVSRKVKTETPSSPSPVPAFEAQDPASLFCTRAKLGDNKENVSSGEILANAIWTQRSSLEAKAKDKGTEAYNDCDQETGYAARREH